MDDASESAPSPNASTFAFNEAGLPVSPRYGDVFRSRTGAMAEARAVFVEGCDLPGEWADRERFTLLELGFGLGVNFLATLDAWRSDPHRPSHLDYVSIERHPLTGAQLKAAHLALGIAGQDAERLAARLPRSINGVQRLSFASGAVSLTLAYGDAAAMVGNLSVAADAFYLDGFSPLRNPQMWAPALMRALARLARPNAALATYSAAGSVRTGLTDAGFDVRVQPGHAGKRHRITARYRPRWRTFAPPDPAPTWSSRSAIVIGAGIAGIAASRALALAGWQVRLLERRAHPLSEGSAQPALADHVHVSPDDNRMSRLARAALLLARAEASSRRPWRGIAPVCRGTLQLPANAEELDAWNTALQRTMLPPDIAQLVEAEAAAGLSGISHGTGGLWLPECEAHDPLALGEQWLADAGDRLHVARSVCVAAIERHGHLWRVLDATGRTIDEAPVIILANAGEAVRLANLTSVQLRRVRGQSTLLRAPHCAGLRVMLAADAYACPMGGGEVLTGSTYDDGDSLASEPEADLSNLRRLARALRSDPEKLIPHARPGATGHRWASRDHLPLVGALPDEALASRDALDYAHNTRLPLPRTPGLYGAFAYGSRGLLWSALAAEVLAALVDGRTPPLERDLLASIDPARFAERSLRRHARIV